LSHKQEIVIFKKLKKPLIALAHKAYKLIELCVFVSSLKAKSKKGFFKFFVFHGKAPPTAPLLAEGATWLLTAFEGSGRRLASPMLTHGSPSSSYRTSGKRYRDNNLSILEIELREVIIHHPNLNTTSK